MSVLSFPRLTQHLAGQMQYRRASVPGASYFFTLITYQRERLFTDHTNVARWYSSVSKVQLTRPFVVEAEVIMPDHLHMIWTLPEADADYATRIRLIKTAFTKNLSAHSSDVTTNASRASKGEREIWQRRYWEHLIRDESDFAAHVDYIHMDPVRNGVVKAARDWPHSSFSEWAQRGVYEPSWGLDELPSLPDWVGRE